MNWADKVVAEPNRGDSWCICMWAFASLIQSVGCDNVHIRCEATDVQYMLENYRAIEDQVDLEDPLECLPKLCPQQALAASQSSQQASAALQNFSSVLSVVGAFVLL